MKLHNKLVRDNILEIIKQDNVAYKSRTLGDKEFRQELLKKLVEEASEVLGAGDDSKELHKELADVWEVIEYIIETFELDQNEIQRLKDERRNSRGGFDNRIYLESTDE